MKTTPTVGQVLYSLNVGNAARYVPQALTPVVVTKIGRKYFTAGEGYRAKQYHVDTWRQKTEYSVDSVLYESEQAYADEKEGREICGRLGLAFEYGQNINRLSLDTLRQIDRLIANDNA